MVKLKVSWQKIAYASIALGLVIGAILFAYSVSHSTELESKLEWSRVESFAHNNAGLSLQRAFIVQEFEGNEFLIIKCQDGNLFALLKAKYIPAYNHFGHCSRISPNILEEIRRDGRFLPYVPQKLRLAP